MVGHNEPESISQYECYQNLIILWEAKPCDPLWVISLKGPHCRSLFITHSTWEYWPYSICSINIPTLWVYTHQVSKLSFIPNSLKSFLTITVWETKFETHGNPFSEDYSCQADPETHSSISGVHECAEKPCSCLCWRNSEEEICDSNFILEASFIPKLAKSGWGRVRVWSSTWWSHNPVQRRSLHWSNLQFELLISKEKILKMVGLKQSHL